MSTKSKVTKAVTGKTSKFLSNALAAANQTEDEKITDAVTTFVEDSLIEIDTQISTREVQDIPQAKLALKRTEQALTKAQKAFEDTRFAVRPYFRDYLTDRNTAKTEVKRLEAQVESEKEAISDIEAEVEEFKAIKADFLA